MTGIFSVSFLSVSFPDRVSFGGSVFTASSRFSSSASALSAAAVLKAGRVLSGKWNVTGSGESPSAVNVYASFRERHCLGQCSTQTPHCTQAAGSIVHVRFFLSISSAPPTQPRRHIPQRTHSETSLMTGAFFNSSSVTTVFGISAGTDFPFGASVLPGSDSGCGCAAGNTSSAFSAAASIEISSRIFSSAFISFSAGGLAAGPRLGLGGGGIWTISDFSVEGSVYMPSMARHFIGHCSTQAPHCTQA